MLVIQPGSSFADRICEELNSSRAGLPHWRTFEFAAAWVNNSGAEKLRQSAHNFLARGGSIRALVGLDFASTSYEGLHILLDLEVENADIETYVFYDENRSCTFHPKVYLFSNSEEARLFVGSNNMTGGGFQTNVEAALEVTSGPDDETIRAAHQTLQTWRQDEFGRCWRLTPELLETLRNASYVRTEEEIRRSHSSAAIPGASSRAPLFGRSTAGPGRRASREAGRDSRGRQTQPSTREEVLLMRVRPRRDGSQVQISMEVLNASLINGATEVVSTDGLRRPIGYNMAHGVRNTARFEAPEMMRMSNPVARFRRINASTVQYEIFDADAGGEGARIYRRLEEGINSPSTTNLSELGRDETVLSISNRNRAQWYRLDEILPDY